MKVLLSGALITLALFGGASAYAGSMEEQSELNEISTTALEEFFLEAKARLNLNDQQVEEVRPILQSSFQARKVILETHGIDLESRKPPAQKLGFREMRSMARELDKVRSDTSTQLRSILTKEQMNEYVRMQNERKSEMRQRLRARL